MKLYSTKIFRNILLAGMSIYLIASCRSTYPTTTDNFTVNYKTADIKHGKALVMNSCGGCHYNHKVGRLIGQPMNDLPKIAGHVYSANLTNSREYSPVPKYSDAELAYLLHTGIKRDGHFVPYMLRPNISDADLKDIIAYLRSGEGAVAATDTSVGHTHLNFIGKLGMHFAGKPLPYRTNVPQPANQIEEGRYLVDNIGCFHCHSKKLTALNYMHPEETRGYLAGGAKLKKPNGDVIHGPNITMDRETGIGKYTKEDFRQAVLHMKGPHGDKLQPPMEAFHLREKECDAIYAYIKTLPPKYHHVKGHNEMEEEHGH